MTKLEKCSCGAKAKVVPAGNGQYKVSCASRNHSCTTTIQATPEAAIAVWNK